MLHIRTSLFAFLAIFSIHCAHAAQAQIKSVSENYAILRNFVYNNEEENAQKFVDAIIDINAQGECQETILMTAIQCLNMDALKLLLKRADINVNTVDNTGRTPLHIAIEQYRHAASLGADGQVCGDRLHIIYDLGIRGALYNPNKLVTTNDVYWRSARANYAAGLNKCKSLKKEQTAYEQKVANLLQQPIPVKDLNSIINDYARMNILDFALTHKQAEFQAPK